MNPPPSHYADLFSHHAQSLRSLARALVSDEHAADDVVQETWVAALERPPADERGMGPWLGTVARRLALRRRRGESRRQSRELGAANAGAAERAAPAAELAEGREVLRHVVDAVLGLEEPYQTLVVMRYYQDRTPREIAQLRGVPVATVASQLHRARQRLRERLDHVSEGRARWTHALVLATGWKPEVGAATALAGGSLGAGVWAVAGTWKLGIVAAGAVALSAWAFWGGTGAATTPLDPPERERDERALEPAVVQSPERDVRQAAATTGEVELAEAIAEDALDPRDILVTGSVFDEKDLPVRNASIYAAAIGMPFNRVASTDRHGRFDFSWRGTESTSEIWLAASNGSGRDPGFRRVLLSAGENPELRLSARRAVAFVSLRMTDDSGTIEGRLEQTVEWKSLGGVIHYGANQLYALTGAPSLADIDGERIFSCPLWPGEGCTSLDFEESMEFEELVSIGAFIEETKNGIVVEGRVSDANGEPVAGALLSRGEGKTEVRNADGEVVSSRVVGASEELMRTDENGYFRLELDRTDELTLRAGGGDHGVAARTWDLQLDPLTTRFTWDPILDRGVEVRGVILPEVEEGDDAGDEEWIVEFESRAGSRLWTDTTRTRGGRFALPNLPEAVGRILVWRDQQSGLPLAVIENVSPYVGGGEPIEIRIDPDRTATATLGLIDENGDAFERGEVRVLQLESGIAKWMTWDGDTDRYRLNGLVAGGYAVLAGAPNRGYVELGERWSTAADDLDLGVISLPRSAQLNLERNARGEGELAEFDWWLMRETPVGWMSVYSDFFAAQYACELPAGVYRLTAPKTPEVDPLRFELAPGETKNVVWPPEVD